MVAACLVLAQLCIVEVNGAYLANHKCLQIGVVVSFGNLVCLSCYLELALLIVELFYKHEQIVLEIAYLLE